jgi:hypothetical protein
MAEEGARSSPQRLLVANLSLIDELIGILGRRHPIQRTPQLFRTLRGLIDAGRRRRRGKGRFLVLGPASIDLLRQSSESLSTA